MTQGLIRLSDSVTHYVPSLQGSAYDRVTVRDILMMSSGVGGDETYTNSSSDRRHLLAAQMSQKPGAAMAVMKSLSRAAAIGIVNQYSTGETQVAAEVLRRAPRADRSPPPPGSHSCAVRVAPGRRPLSRDIL